MQITLSSEAKKEILFKILTEARDKFIQDGFIDWSGNYDVMIKLQFKTTIVKKRFFRKKEIEDIMQIHCIQINAIGGNSIFTDLDWGDLKIKSCNKDYDKVAEYIAQELTKHVSPNQLHLILNNSTRIETMQNPSRR